MGRGGPAWGADSSPALACLAFPRWDGHSDAHEHRHAEGGQDQRAADTRHCFPIAQTSGLTGPCRPPAVRGNRNQRDPLQGDRRRRVRRISEQRNLPEKIAPHERPQHALMLSIPPPYLDPTSVDQIRFRAREISLMKDHFTGSELLRRKLPDMARHRSTSVAVLAPR